MSLPERAILEELQAISAELDHIQAKLHHVTATLRHHGLASANAEAPSLDPSIREILNERISYLIRFLAITSEDKWTP